MTLRSFIAMAVGVGAGYLVPAIVGAAPVAALRDHLRRAGFKDIRIDVSDSSRETIRDWFPGTGAEKYVASARIEATRPGR